jgi:hypothetical protein
VALRGRSSPYCTVMKKTLSNQEKFELAVNKILAQQYNERVGKAQVTKILNQWEKEDTPDSIKRDINAILALLDIPKWADWIQQKFTCVLGSFWLESSSKYGDVVLGWYNINQIQAEPLPLALYFQRFEDDRYCEVLGWGEAWEAKGFAEAVPIPLTWFDREVKVPVEEMRFYCEHGYASPCKIQWERKNTRSHPEDNGYYVTRSIISYGFWQAWKWWPDAWAWYYEHRPELFEDEVFWRAKELPERHNPPSDPYAAVLGFASRNRPTFFLDD